MKTASKETVDAEPQTPGADAIMRVLFARNEAALEHWLPIIADRLKGIRDATLAHTKMMSAAREQIEKTLTDAVDRWIRDSP